MTHDETIFECGKVAGRQEAANQRAGAVSERLIAQVDHWFARNTGLGGCSDDDVRELARLFYASHTGG